MRKSLLLLMVIMAVAGLSSVTLARPNPNATTGKQGWVTLKLPTKFGGHTLVPGTYYFSHEGG